MTDTTLSPTSVRSERTWGRMQRLMEEAPQGAGNYDALIEHFYDPEADAE